MSTQDPSLPDQPPAGSGVPPTDPTQQIPATPPPGGQLPPPAPPGHVTPGSHATPPPKKPSDSQGLGFKIATVVLAVTTAGFAIWAFMATKNLNDYKATSEAQIQQLQAQVANLDTQEGDIKKVDAQKMEAARKRFEEVRGNLKLEKQDIGQLDKQISQLHANYAQLQQQASSQDATLKQKLAASRAQTALAKTCATVLAAGLDQIYIDVPTGVTFKEVAALLSQATDKCGSVVTVKP